MYNDCAALLKCGMASKTVCVFCSHSCAFFLSVITSKTVNLLKNNVALSMLEVVLTKMLGRVEAV